MRLIFLGTSGTIQVPAFHCTCDTCEAARMHPNLRRTRASIALLGRETVLIDVPPEIEYQLEREKIREIDRIFLTHWHSDHMWGISSFNEPQSHGIWKKSQIDLYLHRDEMFNFHQGSFQYIQHSFKIHPVIPGDNIQLVDCTWEIIKTQHTSTSIGFIITTSQKRIAYMVQGIEPPDQTIQQLKEIDILILDATLDELILPKNAGWRDFTISDAIQFWKRIGTERCVLSHLSCHRYVNDHLLAGISPSERSKIESTHPGLQFAYDGLQLQI